MAIKLSKGGAHPLFNLLNYSHNKVRRRQRREQACLNIKISKETGQPTQLTKGSPLTFLLLQFLSPGPATPIPEIEVHPHIARHSTVALVHAGPSSLPRLSLSDLAQHDPAQLHQRTLRRETLRVRVRDSDVSLYITNLGGRASLTAFTAAVAAALVMPSALDQKRHSSTGTLCEFAFRRGTLF